MTEIFALQRGSAARFLAQRCFSTPVVSPLVPRVARSTPVGMQAAACAQGRFQVAGDRSSRCISAVSTLPSCTSTWARPSVQRFGQRNRSVRCASPPWQPISVLAETSPPMSGLSPAFIECCTAFYRTRSSTRPKGAYGSVWRLRVRRRKTSKKTHTTPPRSTNSHQKTDKFHRPCFLCGQRPAGAHCTALKPLKRPKKQTAHPVCQMANRADGKCFFCIT